MKLWEPFDGSPYRYFVFDFEMGLFEYRVTQSPKEAVDLFMANWEEITFLEWVTGVQNGKATPNT